MNNIEMENKRSPVMTPSFLLIVLIPFSFYYIDLGFALKPFMIFLFIIFIISINKFVIHKLRMYEILLLLFFSYYCATSLFAKYPEYSLRIVFGVVLILFCYFIMRYTLSNVSLQLIEKGISISGIIFNVTSIILYLAGLIALNFVLVGNQIREYGVMIDRSFPRLIGTTTDPNIFCFYNLIFFFYYLTHLGKKWSKVGLLLSALTMMLTLSRGAALAILFGLLLIFMTSSIAQKIKFLIILPVTIFLLGTVTRILFSINIIELFVERFTESDGGSGRIDLWMHGLVFFKDNPLFGIGINNFQPYNEELFGKIFHMHNTFLEVLTESGLVGFALYTLIFVFVILECFKSKLGKEKSYLIYTLVTMVFLMGTLSLIINEVFFLLLALIWRYLDDSKISHVKDYKNLV